MKTTFAGGLSLFLLQRRRPHKRKHPIIRARRFGSSPATRPGDVNDLWPRLIAQHMGKYIPGNPNFIVQNMTGAGSMIAANHVYNVAKPDGLTLRLGSLPRFISISSSGRKEVQYDWAQIQLHRLAGARANIISTCAPTRPYKTIEDIRKASEPPKCGSGGATGTGFLFSQTAGRNRRRQVQHRARLSRRRTHRSRRGKRRDSLPRHDHRILLRRASRFTPGAKTISSEVSPSRRANATRGCRDTPTIFELMDQYKTPDQSRRVATVILAGGSSAAPWSGRRISRRNA